MTKKRRRKRSSLNNTAFQATYHRNQSRRGVKPIIRKLILAAVAIALIILGVLVSRIDSVTISGVNDEELEQNIRQSARDRFHFQWQVDEPSVAGLERIYDEEIYSLDYSQDLLSRGLTLSAEERTPVINWDNGETTYLLDREGVVTEQASQDDLPWIVDNAGLPLELGNQAVPEDFIDFAKDVASSDMNVARMRIVETSGELYVELESGYYVRFATNENFDTQIDSMQRTQRIAREKGDTIDEYIDVRIPYKAYYR